MRQAATLLALTFAIVGGYLALAQVDILQDTGETISGVIGTGFFPTVMFMFLLLLGFIAAGTLIAISLKFLGR